MHGVYADVDDIMIHTAMHYPPHVQKTFSPIFYLVSLVVCAPYINQHRLLTNVAKIQ